MLKNICILVATNISWTFSVKSYLLKQTNKVALLLIQLYESIIDII